MRPTAPTFVADGFVPVVFAKDQPEYLPLLAMRNAEGAVVSDWLPSAEELASLMAGQPIRLTLFTFNQRLQPIILEVPPA